MDKPNSQVNKAGNRRRGFTLIELLMVIAIASILASIAVPSYNRYVQQATVSKAFGIMQKAKTEVVQEYSVTGDLPSSGTRYHTDNSEDADIKSIYFFQNSRYTHIVSIFGPGSGELNNKRLWLSVDTSNPNRLLWTCNNYHQANQALPVDALPSECNA